jgi:hypothetical protein
MDSDEIEDILSGNKTFLGCYASNQLPSFPSSFPKSLIINTATSEHRGEHWVALVLYKKRCYYFDSFGLPIINENILRFLNKYKKVTYSDVCIQNTFSEYCGKFCIAFIKYVYSKHSYNQFIDNFDFINLYKNDLIVEHLYI